MATGSESRGTKKVKGKFRTPKLSDAQKRANKLNRALTPRGKNVKTIKDNGKDKNFVPF